MSHGQPRMSTPQLHTARLLSPRAIDYQLPADCLEEGLGSEVEREDIEPVTRGENQQAEEPKDISSRS